MTTSNITILPVSKAELFVTGNPYGKGYVIVRNQQNQWKIFIDLCFDSEHHAATFSEKHFGKPVKFIRESVNVVRG